MTDLNTKMDELVAEIGRLLIEEPDFQDKNWDSLTQIFLFDQGQERGYGYRYDADEWSGAAFDDFAIMDKVLELRARMREKSGKEWQWCRITVVAPEMTTRIDVAYDENLWKMGRKSLDMSDYAMSVRSEHHPDPSAASGDRR